MKKSFWLHVILSGVLATVLLTVGVRAADWSNPHPQTVDDKAGPLLLKHELNMTDLYAAGTGRLNQLKGNFAGTGSPESPNTGQSWYDSANHFFKVYDAVCGGWGCGGFYSSGTNTFYNINSSGTITAGKVVATNLSVSNTITGSVSGNAATVGGKTPGAANGVATLDGSSHVVETVNNAGNADTLDGYHASDIWLSSFSTQTDVTSFRVIGTVYQNTSGRTKFLMVTISTADVGNTITAYSDSNGSPSWVVGWGQTASYNQNVTLSFMVPNNYYYKVTATGSPTLRIWTEWY